MESVADVSIKEEIAPIWLEIAKDIKMDASDIDSILSGNPEAEDCSQAMLEVWMDPEGEVPRPPTWRVLLEALRGNAKADLATKIEQHRESEPAIFHEIPTYLSNDALKQMYEELRAKKGQDKEILSCSKRGSELEIVIKDRNREITSLKKEISRLQEDTPVAPAPAPGPDLEKVIEEQHQEIASLKREISQLQEVTPVPAPPKEEALLPIPGIPVIYLCTYL